MTPTNGKAKPDESNERVAWLACASATCDGRVPVLRRPGTVQKCERCGDEYRFV